MEKKATSVLMNKYELGRLLGHGTFAKVYHARNLKTGENVAIKIIDKEKVLKIGLIDQIKREISTMRLVRHPNVVRLYEVMASKTKIYFAMELVRGGELFDKVARGKLKEDAARKYFQQLIGAVDFCHSRGVYHRDLKPENLLVDEHGNLKVTDFGLSALFESKRQDGLLHTTCGTPAYVAPEVISRKGYDGAKADIWSCGVVLFVLLAGYLPFHDSNLMEMYRKIMRGSFRCPPWFPQEVRKLVTSLLDPNPETRITIEKVMEYPWFRKGFKGFEDPKLSRTSSTVSLSDVRDAFATPETEKQDGMPLKVSRSTSFNAFDLISLSQGFDLSGLFEKDSSEKMEARFTSTKSASALVTRLEEMASVEQSFRVERGDDGVVRLQGSKEGRKGQLGIDAEIIEVTPSFSILELKKTAGDTLEYKEFCDQALKPSLKDVARAWQESLPTVPEAQPV